MSSESPTGLASWPAEAESWLADHAEHDEAELKKAWIETALACPATAPLDPKRVAAVRARLLHQVERRPAPSTPSQRRGRHSRLLWAAAGVVVAVGLGRAWTARVSTVLAPPGPPTTVALPDGSAVTLNAGSELRYKRTFGRIDRELELEGEAFFEVVSGQTPFEVQTFNAVTRVTGTRFNVRAWTSDIRPETEVVVEEGEVVVESVRGTGTRTVLVAGQATLVSDRGGPSEPTSPDLALVSAWRSGGLAARNQSLATVLAEAGRRFGTAVNITDPQLRETRVRIHLARVRSMSDVLEPLAAALQFEFEVEGLNYRVHQPRRPIR